MKKNSVLLLLALCFVQFVQAQYCSSGATSTVDDDIGQVIFGAMANPATAPTPLTNNPASFNTYTDFTTTVPASTYLVGVSYPVSITQINSAGYYTCYANIWIDFNHNNAFDTNERIFGGSTSTFNGGGNPTVGNAEIPCWAQNGITRMRVVLIEGGSATSLPCGTYTWGETEDYLVDIQGGAPNDVGVAEIQNIMSGCGLSATTPITVKVNNFGANPQSNFDVNFRVDGGAVVTETYGLTLAVGTNANYTFTATADLSAQGLHTIEAWTSLVNDGLLCNDSSSITVLHKPAVTAYPYVCDFENPAGGIPLNWENDPLDLGDQWLFNTGATYPGPYPTQDHTTGGGYYAVVQDYTNFDSTILITPCFDLAGMANPSFSFWFHSYNMNNPSTIYENELHVDVFTNGTWDYDAIAPIGHKNPFWMQEVVDLTPYANSIVGLRFRADNVNAGSAHNLAIDDINLKDLIPQDAAPLVMTSPLSSCNLGPNEAISIKVLNSGGQPWSSVPLKYSIDGAAFVNEIYTGTPIFPNDTLFYTFATTGNFSVSGPHTVTIISNLPGDTNLGDDTLYASVVTIPNVSTYPYLETFDVYDGGWTTGFTSGTGTSWSWGAPTGFNLSTSYSAPYCWTTVNSPSGGYISQEQSYIEGPCFNFSALNAPVFEAAINFDLETNWDGVVLQASSNNGATWTTIGTVGSGVNWYNAQGLNAQAGSPYNPSSFGWNASNGGWQIAKHDLTGFAGQSAVKLRLALGADFSVQYEGFSMDNVKIYDKPPFDLGVTDFINPMGGDICASNAADVTVNVENDGSQPQSNYTVVLNIAGPVNTNQTQIVPGPLAVGSTANVTFTGVNLSVPGTYVFTSYTSSALDPIHENDTTVMVINVQPIPTDPIVQNVVLCTPDSTTLTVTNAVPGGFYFWYDAPNGTLLQEGTSFTTPYLLSTTTYYVDAKSELSYSVGKEDNAGPGFSSSFTVGDGLTFNTMSPLTIDSVTIYPTSSGTITITITDALGAVVGATSPFVPSPTSVGAPVRIPVDINIPTPGTGYAMILTGMGVGGLYYNYDGAVYPYNDQGGHLSITNTTNNYGTLYGYYYTFYDWKFSVLGCESSIMPVTVTVGGIQNPNLGPDAITCSGYPVSGVTPGAVSYNWNSGQATSTINVSNTGQYVLTVTDINGCIGVDTINVTVLPAPVANLGPNISGCLASAILDPGAQPGGTTFLWSSNANYAQTQTVTATTSGTYSVYVTNPSGCSDTDTINVVLNGVDADLGADITSCTGSVTLNAGNPGATYLWSNGLTTQAITVTAPGTYSVTVTKPGCTDTDAINVTFGQPPIINLGPDQTTCSSVVLDAGNSGAIYSWSNGATTQTINVSQTGTYTCTILYPGGCSSSDLVNVTALEAPIANFVVQSGNAATGYYQFNSLASTGSFPLTYFWDFGDGYTSSAQNPSHTYYGQGTSTVMLILTNACGSDTFYLDVYSNHVGIDNELTIKDLQVYPNPSNGSFTVSSQSMNADKLEIEVADIQGKVVYSADLGKVSGFIHAIHLPNVAKGVYLLKITTGTQSHFSKLVVE